MTGILKSRRDEDEDNPRRREEGAHRPAQVNLLREVKVDSPIHRLWAGTKIVAVAVISVTLSYFPTWGALGVMALVMLVSTRLAKIPGGAWPRPPVWFYLAILVSGGFASAAGGKPHVHVFGAALGLGAADAFIRFVLVGVELILAAAILGWTTPMGEIAPALAKLMRPLRPFKVPVDELATTIALCIRSLPLLVQEMRTLVAARRLRPPPESKAPSEVERWLDELIDLLVTALAVSVRRAGELAEAITARGGAGMIAARTRRPGRADWVALAVIAVACAGSLLIPH